MEINFFQNGNYYVAEFEVKTDFNLHIERDSGRKLYIYQCTSGGGDYALVNDFCNNNNQNVIDIDFTALVYPKRIKIVSDAEPTYATVVTDGEVTEIKTQSTMEYWDVTALPLGAAELATYTLLVKFEINGTRYIRSVASIFDEINVEELETSLFAVALDRNIKMINNKDGAVATVGEIFESLGVPDFTSFGWKQITEEEFYNLDNGGSSLIEFTINGTTYQAEEGMTWGEFVESNYNDGSVDVHSSGYIIQNGQYLSSPESGFTLEGDAIISGFNYQYLEM